MFRSHRLVVVGPVCLFGLTKAKAETLIDKAIELHYIGGVYGNQKPTEFLCLLLKLLQIQPEKEILVEYLQAEEFKYARLPFNVSRRVNSICG